MLIDAPDDAAVGGKNDELSSARSPGDRRRDRLASCGVTYTCTPRSSAASVRDDFDVGVGVGDAVIDGVIDAVDVMEGVIERLGVSEVEAL